MGFDAAYARAGRTSFAVLSTVAGRKRLAEYADTHYSEDLVASLDFCGMEMEAAEVLSAAALAGALALVLVAGAGAFALVAGLLDGGTMVLLVVCGGVLPLTAFVYVGEYPKRHAAYLRVHSLGDVPEVVSYIVMAMKLNPNMERAMAFAVKNSKRQLARDIWKLMWDLQIRAYDSLDEALAAFADRCGAYGEHFKRAMFVVKSSTGERDEAMRTIALNRALDIVLNGTRSIMAGFMATLHAPTLILYSIFVMVPLALVAMLPAAAIVGFRANAVQLFLLYDLLFPLVTLLYAHSILMRRPAAFAPPDVREARPLLSGWAWAAVAVAAGACIAASGQVLPDGALPFPPTDFIVWGMAAAIAIYCYGTCLPGKRARDEIRAMEAEFADSLFVLGRRMSEGRPPEEGFAYTARMVSGTAIGKAYARAAYNITCLRSTLRDAVLDPGFGAFADVCSDRIRATVSMLVETSAMSGEVAGGSIIRIADHLKELQEVEEEIKKMLFTMTSMLKMTCTVFAPFIAGVTLALSGTVAGIVARTSAEMQGLPEAARPYFPMVPQFTAPSVSTADFTLIVGVYLILLVIILLRFVDGIEHGDDVQEFMYSVGRTLPVAVAVFSISSAASEALFNGLM
ncbi:MAG TPA: hypothetical protein VLT35_02770 [Methanocella sp.]|nr:hypothetical protein [Methanocella sp.]